ncbi:transcriptional regulator [Salinibacterium xinjiangense]|uniref:Transcriptional regulator, GntR family n=1 Tax=Salinibacterium xinjiangense TaxID=386302 RepID=A0A2C8ZB93_9MICO|nr:GntR family transcriptional regulator [Salinibacterium xinjiangense]GGK90206.1 transcriptional regulator [Salinibacterium xinjiangense]SOE61318.1 transcriptional regulator, GntR family [Salinibacterium xinjiangense]
MSHPKDSSRTGILVELPGSVTLDPDKAKHEQVRSRLIEVIMTMKTGDRLSPERELAAQFGVSRMTLRQAISSLATSGYVSRLQGAGTFVADRTISKNTELTGFSEDMSARGFSASSRLLKVSHRPAGAALGHELVLSPADMVYHIERVRMADGIPMCLESIDIPAHLAPGLDQQPLDQSLYEILATTYGIKLFEADQVITPTVVDQEQAGLLHVPVHSPALIVKRLAYDKKRRPIERAESIYRGDRYDIRLTVKRGAA